MTEPTATSAPDDPAGVLVEIRIQMSADGRQAWLALAAVGADTLEIPITREDAAQLIAALAEYVWPGCRLMSATPAGQA